MLRLEHHRSGDRGAAACRREGRRERPCSQMRLQAVYTDCLLTAAYCYPEELVRPLQHLVRTHIQWRQGRQRAAAPHVDLPGLQQPSWLASQPAGPSWESLLPVAQLWTGSLPAAPTLPRTPAPPPKYHCLLLGRFAGPATPMVGVLAISSQLAAPSRRPSAAHESSPPSR